MNASTKRELRAWGRAFGLVLVIFGTLAAIVAAGLRTI